MSTDQADQTGPDPAPAAPRSRPWAGAVWALGAAAMAAVLFVSGLVAGFLLGRASDGTSAASPVSAGQADPQPEGPSSSGAASDPPGASDDAGSAAEGAVDECVVGSWRSVEHEESFSTDQGPVTITGLVRDLEIDGSGTQTVRYDGAEAAMEASGSSGSAVYDGTVVYRVSTSDGSMSFELVSSEGTITVTPAQGEPQVRDLQPGTGTVRYTCDDTRLTQESEGFRAVYERPG